MCIRDRLQAGDRKVVGKGDSQTSIDKKNKHEILLAQGDSQTSIDKKKQARNPASTRQNSPLYRMPRSVYLSLIHISEPTRRTPISYAVFCLKKKNTLS